MNKLAKKKLKLINICNYNKNEHIIDTYKIYKSNDINNLFLVFF